MSIDIAWFPDYGHLMAGIFSKYFNISCHMDVFKTPKKFQPCIYNGLELWYDKNSCRTITPKGRSQESGLLV